MLIVQCESGHQHIDLIACAQHCIHNEERQSSISKNITHVVFIISLPRRRGGTKFMSFQGDTWDCYHMDSLMLSKDSLVLPKHQLLTLKSALSTPINEILTCCYKKEVNLLHRRLQNWISLSLLHSNNVQTEKTMLKRFVLLSKMIKEDQIATDISSNKQTCKL